MASKGENTNTTADKPENEDPDSSAVAAVRAKKTVAARRASEQKNGKRASRTTPGPKSHADPAQDQPIGKVTVNDEKWVLTFDLSNMDVRQLKVNTVDREVQVRGLYRGHKNVWKNINENYTIPDGYPCVSHNNKNGSCCIVARNCQGKCEWHQPGWPFPEGFKWPWEGRPNWPF